MKCEAFVGSSMLRRSVRLERTRSICALRLPRKHKPCFCPRGQSSAPTEIAPASFVVHTNFLRQSEGESRMRSQEISSTTRCLQAASLSPSSPESEDVSAEMQPIEVLRLTEHWVAVNKPPGMLVHRTKLYRTLPTEKLLVNQVSAIVQQHTGTPQTAFVVQRLDKPTSGVIVFALNSAQNAANLQAALQREDSLKRYWALAFGAHMPSSWINENPLKDLVGKNRKQRSARTEFEVLDVYDQADVVAVRARLSTGRRHQIRRHLSNSRHPILGDTSYCKGKLNRIARELYGVTRCCLHSAELCFIDPTTSEYVRIEAPIPEDLSLVRERVLNSEKSTDGQIPNL